MSDTTFLDVSGLLPPEPLEQILEALAAMPAQSALQVLIDREPFPLYRILERHGYRYQAAARGDFRFELTISKLACNAP